MSFDPNQPRDDEGKWVAGSLSKIAKLSSKSPKDLNPTTINKQLDLLAGISSVFTDRMIVSGRGNERILETLVKDDPLARVAKAIHGRHDALIREVQTRVGPGNYKMPYGFKGKRKYGS